MAQTVDVVIPTYENYKMLKEAVDSCKNQTHKVNQIIIVDDGSSESIRRLLELEYNNDAVVNLIFSPHSGLPGVARAIGIQKASADWIAFLDSDDSWEQTKIEQQLKVASESRASLIYTNARIFGKNGESGELLASLPTNLSFRELAKSNLVINSSVLVKREVFDESLTYATSLRVRAAEDYATWLRIRTKYKFAGIDLPLTNYRISENSIRKENDHDPRIYALADFVMWSRTHNSNAFSWLGLFRRIVFKEMRRSYE